MRSHATVIRDAGGVAAFIRRLNLPTHRDAAVRQWLARNSIPPEYWPLLASEGLSTLSELTLAHAARKAQMQAARKPKAA